jgi:hypothetical protein
MYQYASSPPPSRRGIIFDLKMEIEQAGCRKRKTVFCKFAIKSTAVSAAFSRFYLAAIT